jgi:hypothetical protein
MDMSKYAGKESQYLKAGDLGGKNPRLIVSKVSLVEFENDGKREVKPAINFEGKEKAMVLNATNTERMIRKFGADSDSWIGKSVLLGTEYYPKFDREGLTLQPLDISDDPDDEIPF